MLSQVVRRLEKINFVKVRVTENRIAVKLPMANGELLIAILNKLILFAEQHSDYCFLIADPAYLVAGELGFELYPGCSWSEINL